MRTGLRVLPALALCMALAFGLAACGGGGGGGGTASYTIGVTVTGLEGAGLVLRCNAGDDLAITSGATSFTFATPVADTAGYAVTVLTQPSSPNQTCTVNNGTGTVSGADVTGVTVTCSTNSYTIGGTVSGLSGAGLVLQNNAGDDLAITSGATSFTFLTSVADGADYAVTVLTQPSSPNQTCTVNNGTGTVSGADVTDVTVTCSTEAYTIGGTASGIAGSVVLQNNGGDDLTLSADGTFSFLTSVADTAGYAVTIISSLGQACTLASASGTVSGTDVTYVALSCVSITPVSALYNTNGADWNDYVTNDGADEFSASGAACTGDETGGYRACLHGGEMRAVEAPYKTDCTGLTATDSLGAFDWVCDGSTGTAMMVSTGLADGKGLTDLIDFNTPGWKDNSVTVRDGGTEHFSTWPAAWWSNPMALDNSGGLLGTEGTIYVVTSTADLPIGFTMGASKVGLVAAPGAIINGPWAGSNVILADGSSTARDFLWVEGAVEAKGDDAGVYLRSVRFSVLRDVTAENARIGSFLFFSSSNNSLSGVTATQNGEHGVYLDDNSSYNTLTGVMAKSNTNGIFINSSYNTLTGVTATSNTNGVFINSSSYNTLTGVTATSNNNGVIINTSSYNTLTGVTATNNSDTGVYIEGVDVGIYNTSSYNTLSGVTAANNWTGVYISYFSPYNTLSGVTASNNNEGVYISSNNNTLTGVTAANNYWGVNLSSSSYNTLSGVTASNNRLEGVSLSFSSYNTLSGVTAANTKEGSGVSLGFSSYNTLSGVTAANNKRGVSLNSSPNNTLSGVTATNNGEYGVYLMDSSDNYFTGPLKVGYNGTDDCYVYAGGGGPPTATDPGLDDDTDPSDGANDTASNGLCTEQGASDFVTATTGVTLAGSFAGKVSTDDTVNASDTLGTAIYNSISDWNFENAFRAWGRDGSDFPSSDNRDRCESGACRIWDWSLSTGDTGDSGGPALLGAFSLPTGDDTLTHIWNSPTISGQGDCDTEFPGSLWNATDSVCETTLLRNAIEVQGDGLDNDNTLCESGETCLYTPNMGSYQGHGNLVDATDGAGFTDGTPPDGITGVTLMKHETNGY